MPSTDIGAVSLGCGVLVGMNPNLDPHQKHGSVWFDVSGFGRLRRDFVVDEPEFLALNAKSLGIQVAQQVMLLDRTLPKKEHVCIPVQIDIRGAGMRQVYDLRTFEMLLNQKT